MADNIAVTPGTGATIAADDITGVLHQRVKISLGADGSATDALDGAGAVAAGVQRVTLASDDPAVVHASRITTSTGRKTAGSALATTTFQVGGTYNATPPTVGDTEEVGLQVDANGYLKVNLSGGLVPASLGAKTGANSLSVVLASDPATRPVSLESNSLYAAGTAMTPKFAIIDAATSGDNTLVAAVASKKIRVLSLYLVAAGSVNVRFESGAGGTALSGQMNLVVNTGFVLPFNPLGWFETASNTLLNLELSGAVSVDGGLVYVEV